MWKLKVAEGGRWLTSLNNHAGRQHWEFDPDAGTPEERAEVERLRLRFKSNRFVNKQSSDELMRMQMRKEKGKTTVAEAVKVKGVEEVTEEAVTTTLVRGIDYWCSIQAHDGHWPADNAGPLFFFPPLVMALYVTKGLNTVLPSEHQKEIKRYIYNHQNEDGGWGLHIESHSAMFCSVITYVALRLLGEGPDDGEDGAVARARKWILDHGGAAAIPSWGKFWLAILGLYEWDGCNPLPPESWLLPNISPVHPGKLAIYARLVYLPMSYLYGKRFIGEITPLIQELRRELYVQPYHQVNWNLARNTFAQEDVVFQHPLFQDMFWGFLYHVWEPIVRRWPLSKLREKGIKVAMEHIHYEDANSRYMNIGCVEKILFLMACWVEDPNSEAYKFHLARIPDFFWVAEDGMKLQAMGSQLWDAVFSIQAIMSSDMIQRYGEVLGKAHDFVKASQVRENPSGNYKKMYRHISKGAWIFAIQDHGLAVSDCTADGLTVAMLLSQMPKELVGEKLEAERLYDAVNVLLSLQSPNGGFPGWEPSKAYPWLEKFNPTDSFKDVLIDFESVECTSAAVQSLVLFKKLYPDHRRKEIESCIKRSIQNIVNEQNPDGSWFGNWGTCFTYGTWFAVEALTTCEMSYNNCPNLRKACEFLLSKQLPDGGWGESYLANLTKVYTNIEGNKSNLVQTSWALLALIKAGQNKIDPTPIKKGVMLLINSQVEEDGDFPQQETTGVFFRSSILHFASYRNVFPILALGEYRRCLLSP